MSGRARCGACRLLHERWCRDAPPCTRKKRLCDEFDPRFAELLPGRSLDHYVDIHRSVKAGDLEANRHIQHGTWNDNADSWVKYMCQAHQIHFKAIPTIAGHIRKTTVRFGWKGHERPGVDPELIETELSTLYTRFMLECPLPQTEIEFSRWAARFLEGFFRIHPFLDGNGRIARMFIKRRAADAGLREMQFPSSSEQRRRYMHALEYAHRYHPRDGNAAGDNFAYYTNTGHMRKWYGPLAHWISKCFQDVPDMVDPRA